MTRPNRILIWPMLLALLAVAPASRLTATTRVHSRPRSVRKLPTLNYPWSGRMITST